MKNPQRLITFIIFILIYILVPMSSSADWWTDCTQEREKFCKNVQSGGGRIMNCLNEHKAELSDLCINSFSGGGKIQGVSNNTGSVVNKSISQPSKNNLITLPVNGYIKGDSRNARIVFLHHSTGQQIWNGGVAQIFQAYNAKNGTSYQITETAFPNRPYPWDNYPYDFWNIWVNHSGNEPFNEQSTLEILTKQYNVIIFKHCFPVSAVMPNTGNPNVGSNEKKIENYKLQYNALKKKLHEFPDTKFIIWTGAALLQNQTNDSSARLAKEFFDWVKNVWDEKGDNIYIWDFRELETEGGLYLKEDNASSNSNSHPGISLSRKIAPLFVTRVINVMQGKGDNTSLTGDER